MRNNIVFCFSFCGHIGNSKSRNILAINTFKSKVGDCHLGSIANNSNEMIRNVGTPVHKLPEFHDRKYDSLIYMNNDNEYSCNDKKLVILASYILKTHQKIKAKILIYNANNGDNESEYVTYDIRNHAKARNTDFVDQCEIIMHSKYDLNDKNISETFLNDTFGKSQCTIFVMK